MVTYVVGHLGDLFIVIKVTEDPTYHVVATCSVSAEAIAIAAALNDA